MFTYSLIAIPFFVVVFFIDFIFLKTKVIYKKKTWKVMAVMILITAVFDQFLTGLPIVYYNESNMLNFRILYAPIEDFTYTIAGTILIGSSIEYGKRKNWL